MYRVLAEIGPITLYSYGFMMAISFFVGIWICGRRAAAYGFTRDQVYDSAVPVLLAGLIGAKIAYVATSWEDLSLEWRYWFSLIRGGFVYYGGVAGGAAGAIWWMRRRNLPPLGLGDLAAPSLGVALAIGRLGCWLNGCCYGTPVAWGCVFPGLHDVVPRHPVQLYEAAGTLAIGLGLLFVPHSLGAHRGRTFALFLIPYSFLRFSLEFLRDDPRGPVFAAGLSVSQVLSVAALAIGLWLLFRRGSEEKV